MLKPIRVNLPSLLRSAADDCATPAITMGFQIALGQLKKIAERSVELNDPILLESLGLLGLVEEGAKEEQQRGGELGTFPLTQETLAQYGDEEV